MKLTVGLLPAAVYWRRRAIVLGGSLVAVLTLWASCSSTAASNNRGRPVSAVANGSAAPSTGLLTPDIADSETNPTPSGASTVPAPTVTPTEASTPSDGCTDAEIQLTPVAEMASSARGTPMSLYLRVKNTSSRTCRRDLGADAQELYLVQGSERIWSSDSCGALHGTSVRSLAPNEEQQFTAPWNGRSSTRGCTNQQAPAPGTYQLVARLGQKTSNPVSVVLT